MVQVKISYNVYLDAMSIYIDGRPIPPVSRLTRFQAMPFGYWCADIFRAIAEEVNDRFSLVYVGRPCESRVLGGYMGEVKECVSYSNSLPDLADNALTRLRRLSTLCQSGVTCERFSVALHLYTDLPETDVLDLVNGCLPKLAYCRVTPKCHPISDLSRHPDATPAFVLTAREPQFITGRSAICVLSTAPGDRNIQCRDNCFLERTRADALESRLKEYLELLLYPHILRKALGALRVPESSPLFPSVTVLDKTEPQTIVTLPSSVELGQTAPVKVRTVPDGAAPAKLIYRISDESVVRMTDRGLQAVGTGEAVVEVYVSGQTVKLTGGKVTAYRRNRIRKLQIQQSDIEISVGDRVTLKYTYEPADADNESAIRLVSSDGTVAAPERGTTFVARKPGTCRMVLQAEQVASDVHVKVYPRLEALKLEMDTTKMRVGELATVKVTRVPETATLDKLVYTVSPENLGIYDVSTRSFCPKNPGTGTLTVSSRSGAVKASCPLEVKRGGGNGKGGCLFSVLMALSAFGAMAAMLLSII